MSNHQGEHLVMRPLDLDRVVLREGAHSEGEGMCLMEAVAYMAGEPWTDRPECASPVIAEFGRRWNDHLTDRDRQMLVPYIPRIVGTAASPEVEKARMWMAADWLIRTHTPAWLRLAGLSEHADAIAGAATIDRPSRLEMAYSALAAAEDAAQGALAATRVLSDAARAAALDAIGVAIGNAGGDAAEATVWIVLGAFPRSAESARAVSAAAAESVAASAESRFAALRPTVELLQRSALDLLDRMIDCEVAS